MVLRLVRTKDELREARRVLGLSAEGLAMMVRMADGRTVRRWESGESEIPGPVTVVLETAMGFLREIEDFTRQLEILESGVMPNVSHSWGSRQEVTITQDISRLRAAKSSLEQALAVLTRQPPNDGQPSNRVHWYNLERIIPVHDPLQKNRWSVPGETSPEAALAHFAKPSEFGSRLEICDENDLDSEFILEKQQRLLTQFGASQSSQMGDRVGTFHVKRA